MSDIPCIDEVNMSEYADDLLVYYSGHSITTAIEKIQLQITSIQEWAKLWGFKINIGKTKVMVHTLKNHSNPIILLDNVPIKVVTKKKYLGLIIDSPRLTWKPHIDNLIHKCLPSINVMRSIANHAWGADRKMLLNYYVAVIRSKLDYGCQFYSTLTCTQLKLLDKIQNTCVRIALGVWKTSPISSMEVESNIPPLKLHREYLTMKYYYRIAELPMNLPVTQALFKDSCTILTMNWNKSYKVAPFIIRVRSLLNEYKLPNIRNHSARLISPIHPWIDINQYLNTEFSYAPVEQLSNEMAVDIFRSIQGGIYENYAEIYTDGSVIKTPNLSTTSAMQIATKHETQTLNWKLCPETSVMGAELFAILKALRFSEQYLNSEIGVVIYSDSLSSMMLIRNRCPINYVATVYEIQQLLISLNGTHKVRLQYIPGHKNINGNENADKSAKAAHLKHSIDYNLMSKCDAKNEILPKLVQKWQSSWIALINESNKGKYIRQIKEHVSDWPWAYHKNRKVETTLARLRIGHAGFKNIKHRFNLEDDNLCECGNIDNVDHFMFHCTVFNKERDSFKNKILNLNVTFNLQNILGGGNFSEEKQSKVIDATASFLLETGKIWQL